MQAAAEYYSEYIKSARDIENEEKRNLFISKTGANEGMIVNDKVTVENWLVDNEFGDENVVISSGTRTYINDSTKKN